MTFSEKLSCLRRRQGLSQEQLAGRLGVTRQSVSKWESGQAFPEIGKLIALSELFRVSVDYLVRDGQTAPEPEPDGLTDLKASIASLHRQIDTSRYAYTSRMKFLGLPLVSIRFGSARSPDRNNTAIGIIAIGNFAVGGAAVGLISLGLLSVGMVAFGLLLAIGMVSIGTVSLGITALGGWAFGLTAVGVRMAKGGAASQLIETLTASRK